MVGQYCLFLSKCLLTLGEYLVRANFMQLRFRLTNWKLPINNHFRPIKLQINLIGYIQSGAITEQNHMWDATSIRKKIIGWKEKIFLEVVTFIIWLNTIRFQDKYSKKLSQNIEDLEVMRKTSISGTKADQGVVDQSFAKLGILYQV